MREGDPGGIDTAVLENIQEFAMCHGTGARGLVGYVNVAGEAGGKRTVCHSILQNIYKCFLFMYVCVCVHVLKGVRNERQRMGI